MCLNTTGTQGMQAQIMATLHSTRHQYMVGELSSTPHGISNVIEQQGIKLTGDIC